MSVLNRRTNSEQSHNLYNTNTEMLQKYTGFKEQLVRMRQLKTALCNTIIIIIIIIHNGYYSRLHGSLKMLILRPAVCVCVCVRARVCVCIYIF
jgi:hypothetical protein